MPLYVGAIFVTLGSIVLATLRDENTKLLMIGFLYCK